MPTKTRSKGQERAAEPAKASARAGAPVVPLRGPRVTTRAKKALDVRGRPRLLTDEARAKILEPIRGGAYLETAVRYSGVAAVSTVYKWLVRARVELGRLEALRSEGIDPDVADPDPKRAENEQPYVELLEAIERAEAEAEIFHVLNVRKLAKSEDENVALRASLAYLGRRRPARSNNRPAWGDTETEITVGIAVAASITVEEQRDRTMSIAEAARRYGAYEAAEVSVAQRREAGDA